MAKSKDQSPKPPYLAYTTFINTIKKLAEHGVPTRIDSSLFKSQSNSTIAALLIAYKYLGLTDEFGIPTPLLRELTAAINHDGERGRLIGAMIAARFSFLQSPNLDMKEATLQQVQQAFQQQGMSGSSITKAVSFYVAAASDAGIELSKYITKTPTSIKSAGAGPRKKAKKTTLAASGMNPPGDIVPPRNQSSPAELLLAKFPEFDPTWPPDIKKQWFESFAILQTAMIK